MKEEQQFVGCLTPQQKDSARLFVCFGFNLVLVWMLFLLLLFVCFGQCVSVFVCFCVFFPVWLDHSAIGKVRQKL